MNKSEVLKMLEQCQHEVAVRHQLGSKLVTGHRKNYYDEAALLLLEKLKIIPKEEEHEQN